MKSLELKKIEEKSEINYDYRTIRVTKSRIDKGLLAIPRSLSNYFPKEGKMIGIYLDDSQNLDMKTFSSFNSTTNENRIGGLKNWFRKNEIKEGEEVVLQIIDKNLNIYRLIRENFFLERTKRLQKILDQSENEIIISNKINQISNWTHIKKDRIIKNEYIRLSNLSTNNERKIVKDANKYRRELCPTNIRFILGYLYKGMCQVCSFTFLKIDKTPYFELHHLDPIIGHNPKNLVLVCANCHRQFEHAKVRKQFDKNGWLSRVTFNDKEFSINQTLYSLKKEFVKTIYE
jgi:predicted HNH restriction endonuclease